MIDAIWFDSSYAPMSEVGAAPKQYTVTLNPGVPAPPNFAAACAPNGYQAPVYYGAVTSPPAGISDADVERIARRVVELLKGAL